MTDEITRIPITVARKRWLPSAIVAVVGLLITLVAFMWARTMDGQHLEDTFRRLAEERVSAVTRVIDDEVSALVSLSAFYDASNHVDRDEFRAFGEPLLARHGGIRALEWVPRVAADERTAVEQAARQEGLPDFRIKELTDDGDLVVAGSREEYFPVCYAEPLEANRRALGLDLGSNPARREVLMAARDSGEIVATPGIRIVQATGENRATLIFLPKYAKGETLETVAQRREHLLGFVVAVMQIDDLLNTASSYFETDEICLQLTDESAAPGQRLLAERVSDSVIGARGGEASVAAGDPLWRLESDIPVGGRTWRLTCQAGTIFAASRRSFVPWGVLGSGLLFTGLLASYIAMLVGRTSHITQVVNERTAEVRASTARLRAVVNTAVDGIITIDQRGTISFVNPAVTRLFGYEGEELIGRNVNLLMPEPYAAQHDGYLAEYMRSGQAQIIGIGREVTGRHRDGTEFPMYLSIGEFELEGRSYFTGIVQDITDRKRAEELIQQANDELEQKNRELEQFVYTASHDLKSPIVTIQGFVGYLKRDAAEGRTDRLADFAEHIEKAACRMRENIDDLLELSRIGRVASDPAPVEIGAVVGELLVEYDERIRKKGVTVRVADDLPVIEADRGRIVQVFDNLIANALKYGCGDQDPVMEIGAGRIEGEHRIFVRDNGPGIEPEYQHKVFGLFERLSTDTGGTGIGLAIVKRIVEVHGGRAWIESEPGSGATFWLAFPEASRSAMTGMAA